MALSKAGILKHAGVYRTKEVHVPALADESGDDVVLVRGMTIREFELNQARAEDGKATASVIARCVVDESGGRLFEDKDVDSIAELQMEAIQPLSEAIAELSGLGGSKSGDEAAADVAVADAEGKSEPTGDSGTASS